MRSREFKPISAADLGQQLPDIAARARLIAHNEWNWMLPPRDIFGWEETTTTYPPSRIGLTDDELVRLDPSEDRATYSRIRRACDGWVPVPLLLEGAERSKVTQVDGEPWCWVEDLEPYLVTRYLLVEHQSRAVFTYTVDVPPNAHPQRHLSIQIPVPGQLSQGELVRYQAALTQLYEPIVLEYFPAARLGVPVRTALRAGDAWPVVDPSLPRELRAQTWKTPVVFDFVQDHDPANATAPRRRATILGPDGNPL
jgi:hypothetical protein